MLNKTLAEITRFTYVKMNRNGLKILLKNGDFERKFLKLDVTKSRSNY